MIYSKSSEYAIRAAIHLAKLQDGECAMAKDIAREEEIPGPFLAKILQELARKGVLHSVKGPSGGFRLHGNASEIRLLDIVGAVDDASHYDHCIAGFKECSEKTACPLHDSWMALHSRIMDYLERNTVGSLVKVLDGKQKAAAKQVKKRRESRKASRTSL
jgi:Rrf2 family transcriptional regulator, iron-sulfur cluster assembly transcription factor